MRFFTGLITGVVLTVGTAFIADAMHAAPGPEDKTAQKMVNWTVVSENIKDLSTDVQDGWSKLVGQVKEIDKKG